MLLGLTPLLCRVSSAARVWMLYGIAGLLVLAEVSWVYWAGAVATV
jgi:hypothetical protein